MGFRSLLAFWAGGAGRGVQAPEHQDQSSGGTWTQAERDARQTAQLRAYVRDLEKARRKQAPVESRAGGTATRRAHNPEIPGATPGLATFVPTQADVEPSMQAGRLESAAAKDNRRRIAILIALMAAN